MPCAVCEAGSTLVWVLLQEGVSDSSLQVEGRKVNELSWCSLPAEGR